MSEPLDRDARRPLASALFGLALGLACLAGAALRLCNLRAQVLGGDELHSVRLAMSTPLRVILFRHTEFDHGRPLTALYHALMGLGVVFDETTFRVPILAAGLVLLVLFPLVLARVAGRGAACVGAWLMAVSPVWVLYSRIVRTYVPVALLAFLALSAFWLWLERGRTRDAALYAACAVLAAFTHVLAAPFVLAPLVYAALERRVPARRLLLVAGATLAALLALYLPLLGGLERLAATRASRSSYDLGTWLGTAGMQAGGASVPFVAGFWLLATLGAVRGLRLRPRLAGYVAFVCAVHVLALVLLAPKQGEKALVFSRYVMVVSPFTLAAVALALGRPVAPQPGARLAQALVATAFVVWGFLAGPLATREFREGSFVHHNRFVSFVERAERAEVTPPEPYLWLAGRAPGPVLEFPWNPQWNHSLAPAAYQATHRREVVVAGRQVTAEHPHVRLRNAVPLDVDPIRAFLESRARWLVVHLDIGREEERFGRHGSERGPWKGMRQDGQAMARELARRFGPPDRADEDVLLWDLERLRAADQAGATGGGSGGSGQDGAGGAPGEPHGIDPDGR